MGERRAMGLLAADAAVTVVSPEAVPGLAEHPDINWLARPYQPGEVVGYRLAIGCSNVPEVNAQVFADGEAAGVWTNSADNPDNCAFSLPSVVRRGDVQLAVSTNGRSPAVAAWLRRQLEARVTDHHVTLLELCDAMRLEARSQQGTSELRGWAQALDAGVYELVAAGDLDAARELLRTHLGLVEPNSVREP